MTSFVISEVNPGRRQTANGRSLPVTLLEPFSLHPLTLSVTEIKTWESKHRTMALRI